MLRTATVVTIVVLATSSSISAQSSTVTPSSPPPPAETGWLSEPRVITNSIDFLTSRFEKRGERETSGFYPELSNQVSGAGWVSAGPGYRKYLSDRLFVDGSAAVSWHLYTMAQGKIELESWDDRATIGVQGMWRDLTQVSYFGTGPDSIESDRSQYRIKTTDVVGYLALNPANWLTFGGTFGWLREPILSSPAGTFRGDYPDTRAMFPNVPGASLESQPSFLHGEASVTADTRDHRGYPTRGALYRAALTIYRDQGAGSFSFTEYQAEALHLVPLIGRRWTVALHGFATVTDVPPGHAIPIYLQPSVGGHNTLRSYSMYRFHDDNMLVANVESRWALYDHVDVAAFVDAGNVARSVGRLNLDKTSYGAGVRVHTSRTTLARVEVAHGAEGWKFFVRTSDPFALGRVRHRVALLPFAP